MSPFLFPILLLIYGECSEDKLTRFTSRLLFYGHCFSLILMTTLPPDSSYILLYSLPYFVSYGYLIHRSTITPVKVLLSLLTVLQCFNYLSLYFQSYTLFMALPFYFEYSNVILREISMMCVCFCTRSFKVDVRLKLLTLILYLIEYSYITGI